MKEIVISGVSIETKSKPISFLITLKKKKKKSKKK